MSSADEEESIHELLELPRLFRLDHGAITCGACRRSWRIPAVGMLSGANFAYLCEHADDHTRVQRRLPPVP